MQVRFGKSGLVYDDWKGIFSFPFEVEVFKNGCCHQYILNIVNWRSTVEISVMVPGFQATFWVQADAAADRV